MVGQPPYSKARMQARDAKYLSAPAQPHTWRQIVGAARSSPGPLGVHHYMLRLGRPGGLTLVLRCNGGGAGRSKLFCLLLGCAPVGRGAGRREGSAWMNSRAVHLAGRLAPTNLQPPGSPTSGGTSSLTSQAQNAAFPQTDRSAQTIPLTRRGVCRPWCHRTRPQDAPHALPPWPPWPLDAPAASHTPAPCARGLRGRHPPAPGGAGWRRGAHTLPVVQRRVLAAASCRRRCGWVSGPQRAGHRVRLVSTPLERRRWAAGRRRRSSPPTKRGCCREGALQTGVLNCQEVGPSIRCLEKCVMRCERQDFVCFVGDVDRVGSSASAAG